MADGMSRQNYYVRPPYMGAGLYGAMSRGRPSYGAEFTGGQQIGTELMSGIVKMIQQNRQNAIANQLMNTQNAPRAGLVSPGVNPQTGQANVIPAGVGTAGSAPATGGVEQLAIQQQMNQQALADALKRAQIARELALAQPKPAQTGLTPYQQLQSQLKQQQIEATQQQNAVKAAQAEREKGAITAPDLAKRFDATYGKGEGEKFFNAWMTQSGGRGSNVNGQFVGDPNGDYFTYATVKPTTDPKTGVTTPPAFSDVPKVRMDELQNYVGQLKAIQDAGGKLYPAPRAQPVLNAAGQQVISSQPAPQQTGSAQDQGAGTLDPFGPGGQFDVTQGGAGQQPDTSNLPAPMTQDEYDALPSQSSFLDGDGQVKVKP